MIGLREDQREKAQLVGKINALFPEWRDTFVANGLVVARRLAPRHNKPRSPPITGCYRNQVGGWVANIDGR